MGTIPLPGRPYETITMDFITGPPASHFLRTTCDAILVIVDVYSKWTVYISSIILGLAWMSRVPSVSTYLAVEHPVM